MIDLAPLLELQRHDSAIDRLKRRKDDLPEKKELAALGERLEKLNILIAKHSQLRDDAAREQKRREDEIEIVDRKVKREEERLYSGSVTSPKELKTIQDEVDALKKHDDEMETALLGAMDETEKLDRELVSLKKGEVQFISEAEALKDKIMAASSDIDVELRIEEETRVPLAESIPADLMVLYERLRGEKSGIAIARLEGATCQGCRLELPSKDIDRIAGQPLPRCSQCDRLLVIK